MSQLSPSSARQDMTVDEMIHLIENAPPGPWPPGWAAWPNVNEAIRVMARRFAESLTPSRHTYPQQRGIVIAGGGLKYFPSVWVGVSRLDRPTCHLQRNGDGSWHGQWLEHERMPIEFIPLEA